MDPVTPRSRRAVLAGALGGLAAAAASSLIRPSPAAAADGGPVLLGASDNSATLNTGITNTAGGTVLTSTATGSGYAIVATGNAGRGVSANTQTGSAVRASANGAGYGVYSTSTAGTGVLASSTSGVALRVSSGAQAAAISSTSVSAPSLVSKATGGTIGVVGLGGNFTPALYPEGGVGVLGDNPAAGGVGVWGRSVAGSALVGDGVTGYGVEAYGAVGVLGSGDFAGVIGDVDGATGVQGWSGALTAPDPGVHVGVWAGADNGRTALKVQGVTRMNRSGRASIGSTKSSVTVTVPGGISSTSLGFANLQTNRAGYYVQAVALGTTSITIYLNKALTTATYVSWLVIDRP